MIQHDEISKSTLRSLIKQGSICLGGNRKLKIYGRLDCASGKRMKMVHRVFFQSQEEAIGNGFRPCGHCMHTEYKRWKDGTSEG